MKFSKLEDTRHTLSVAQIQVIKRACIKRKKRESSPKENYEKKQQENIY